MRTQSEPSTYVRGRNIYGPGGLLPVGRSTFYALVAAGKIYSPFHVGRCALWHREQLLREFEEPVR